jgi:IclR helix-turn-helix domain
MPKRMKRASKRAARQLASASEQEILQEPVRIQLSKAQVNQIVREASGAGSLSFLLGELEEGRGGLADVVQLEERGLSRSLLLGLMMLASFPRDGSYVGVADTARRLQLHISTAHRYVSTLAAVGLLERDVGTRRYRRVS